MTDSTNLDLFQDEEQNTTSSAPSPDSAMAVRKARSGTFTDNMKLPIHRWFRYSAGFSAEWVESVIHAQESKKPLVVLDPFAGSGTTVIAAQLAGAKGVGFESHPFVARIAKAKLLWPSLPLAATRDACKVLLSMAQGRERPVDVDTPALLNKCYSEEALSRLFSLRDSLAELEAHEEVKDFLWLAITSILRPCSHVGTAQWQYVLPNKTKAKVIDPYTAFEIQINNMLADIKSARERDFVNEAAILYQDARTESQLAENSVDLVVTSPPYPNNYDYADATRLEMTFWGEVESWGGLQEAVRQYIVRSCSQHSAAEKLDLDTLLSAPEIAPISAELTPVCTELSEVRLTKGGKKTYHTMVAAYFIDLANVFIQLRRVCKPGSQLCFVVGDSAPYGVHVPAEKWLGELAVAAGFYSPTFEKLRDRNIKWKNRKHRVPLHEGRLWIKG